MKGRGFGLPKRRAGGRPGVGFREIVSSALSAQNRGLAALARAGELAGWLHVRPV